MLLAQAKAPYAQEVQSGPREKDAVETKSQEPLGLVEKRLQVKAKRGPFGVPDAVIIAGYDPETILTWRKLGVISHAARAGLHPIAIVAFQLVFEPHPQRDQETQGCVMKLQIVRSRFQRNVLAWRERFLVDD